MKSPSHFRDLINAGRGFHFESQMRAQQRRPIAPSERVKKDSVLGGVSREQAHVQR